MTESATPVQEEGIWLIPTIHLSDYIDMGGHYYRLSDLEKVGQHVARITVREIGYSPEFHYITNQAWNDLFYTGVQIKWDGGYGIYVRKAPAVKKSESLSFTGEMPCIAPDTSQYFTPGDAPC